MSDNFTNVPCDKICSSCNFKEYHVDTLNREQHLWNPIKLNSNHTAAYALIIVLPAPYLDQKERMGELKRLMIKHYSRFNTHQVYVIFSVACNYGPLQTLNIGNIKKCSIHFKRMFEACASKHKKIVVLTSAGKSILALKGIGFRFSDISTTNVQGNRLSMHTANPYKAKVFCTVGFDAYTMGTNAETVWSQDIEFLEKSMQGKVTLKTLDYEIIDSLQSLNLLFAKIKERLLKGRLVMALDTETTSLNIYGCKELIKLLTFQISFEVGKGYTLPIDHKDIDDNIELREACKRLLRMILINPKIIFIAHNAMYDFRVLHRLGYQYTQIVFDTMLMHHLYESCELHGLNMLTRRFLQYGDYELPLTEYKEAHPEANPKKGGNYGNIPLHILGEYGAYDAAATYELFLLFTEELKDMGLFTFYMEHVYPALLVLLKMSANGIRVDRKELERYYVEYAEKMNDYYMEEIATLKGVQAYEASMPQNAEYFEYQDNPDMYKAKNPRKRKMPEYKRFNVKSNVDLPILLKDYYNIPVLDKTKKGEPSYNKQVREYLFKFDVTKNPWNTDLTIIHKLHTYMLQRHEYSAFINSMYAKDRLDEFDRVHASINIAATKTGRLAMSDPNLQQLPSSSELLLPPFKIKKLFRPVEGLSIVQYDYSQAELRVLASVAEDKAMLDAFDRGEDIHRATASKVMGVAIEDVTAEERQAAKAINFGLVYGLGLEAFALDFYNGLKGDDAKAKEMYTKLVNEGYSGDYSPSRRRR